MDSILSIYWTDVTIRAKLFLSGVENAARKADFPFRAGGRPMHSRLRSPLSFPAHSRNLPQEAGGEPARSRVNIQIMKWLAASLAAVRFAPLWLNVSRWLLPVVLLVVQWLAARADLEAAVVATPRVTFVVFADKPMPDDEWAALSSALGDGFERLALETHYVFAGFQVVRGSTPARELQFEGIIPIFLHGSCHLVAEPDQHEIHGPLGWVVRDHDEIRPFVHVDCGRITHMLSQTALWMNRSTRMAAMAEAISRVVLHEWVHIATQSAAHARDGIEKRSFVLEDLIPDFARMIPHAGGR